MNGRWERCSPKVREVLEEVNEEVDQYGRRIITAHKYAGQLIQAAVILDQCTDLLPEHLRAIVDLHESIFKTYRLLQILRRIRQIPQRYLNRDGYFNTLFSKVFDERQIYDTYHFKGVVQYLDDERKKAIDEGCSSHSGLVAEASAQPLSKQDNNGANANATPDENFITGIKKYKDNRDKTLAWYSRLFFDTRRGEQRAIFYLTLLENPQLSEYARTLIHYALLASEDGNELKKAVSSQFPYGSVEATRDHFQNEIIRNGSNYEGSCDVLKYKINEIVQFANSDPDIEEINKIAINDVGNLYERRIQINNIRKKYGRP